MLSVKKRTLLIQAHLSLISSSLNIYMHKSKMKNSFTVRAIAVKVSGIFTINFENPYMWLWEPYFFITPTHSSPTTFLFLYYPYSIFPRKFIFVSKKHILYPPMTHKLFFTGWGAYRPNCGPFKTPGPQCLYPTHFYWNRANTSTLVDFYSNAYLIMHESKHEMVGAPGSSLNKKNQVLEIY